MDVFLKKAATNDAKNTKTSRHFILCISALLLFLAGCSTSGNLQSTAGAPLQEMRPAMAPAMKSSANSSYPEPTALIIRSGSQELRAKNVLAIKPQLVQITTDAGGRVSHSSQQDDDYLHVTLRIPEPLLDQVMAQFAALAEVKSSSLSSSDVTDQVLDLQARLNSMRALRDRLLSYLNRTADLEEILKVERELTRVQSDIERMEGTLKRLKNQVAMSTLTIQVYEKKKRWW